MIGDSHDYWQVEVVDDLKRTKVDRIHSPMTRLRFKHKHLGCYPRAVTSILLQWGFKKVEVSWDKENNPEDAHKYWNVESHWNDRCNLCFFFFFAPVMNLTDQHASLSARWRYEILSIAIPSGFLAPQRGYDDVEQHSYSRPG